MLPAVNYDWWAVLTVAIAAVVVLFAYFRKVRITADDPSIVAEEVELRCHIVTRSTAKVRLRWGSHSGKVPREVAYYIGGQKTSIPPGQDVLLKMRPQESDITLVFRRPKGGDSSVEVKIEASPRPWPLGLVSALGAEVRQILSVPASEEPAAEATQQQPNNGSSEFGAPAAVVPTFSEPDTAAAPSASTLDTEAFVVGIANECLREGSLDRRSIRARCAAQGLTACIWSPARVVESTDAFFDRHWFSEDNHAGSWLAVPIETGARYLAVPLDRRSLKGELALTHLASLFEYPGGLRSLRSVGAIRVVSAATLRPLGDGSYAGVNRGVLASDIAGPLPGVVNEPSATNDVVMQDILRRLLALEEVHGARSDRSAERLKALEDKLRNFDRGLDELSRRVEQADGGGSASASGLNDHRLERLEAEVANLSSTVSAMAARVPFDQVGLPADVSPALDRVPTTRLESARRLSLRESDWRSALAQTSWFSHDDEAGYAAAVQSLYRSLSRQCEDGCSVQLIHVLPVHGSPVPTFRIHLNDALTEDGGVVTARCVDAPATRTPIRQFYVAYGSADASTWWLFLPRGEYKELDFGLDVQALVDRAPSGVFSIYGIERPAQLDHQRDGVYRIAAPMVLRTDADESHPESSLTDPFPC